jgi:hypothetical protein
MLVPAFAHTSGFTQLLEFRQGVFAIMHCPISVHVLDTTGQKEASQQLMFV